MYFSLTCSPSFSSSSTTPFLPQNPIFNSPSFSPRRHLLHRQFQRFSVKSSQKPLNPFTPPLFRFSLKASASSLEKQPNPSLNPDDDDKSVILKWVAKSIAFTVFSIAIGFSPIRPGTASAIPLVPAAVGQYFNKRTKTQGKDVVLKHKDHEYSDYTRTLLETVSGLLNSIEQARSGNGSLKDVELALKQVRSKKKELQDEIIDGLYGELRELKAQKEKLLDRSEKVLNSVLMAQSELESLLAGTSGPEGKVEIVKLDNEMRRGEKEYNDMLEKVSEIDDQIMRRETMALSIGARELSFIEGESERLVENFRREMRQQSNKSVPKVPLTKLARSDIARELQNSTRKLLEQMILPSVLEAEDIGYPFHQDSAEFAQRIKQAIQHSRELQSNMESGVRKKMKKFGDEKCFVVNTPVDEIVKGFPEVELKWMFGSKEVVIPKAVSIHLFHGWKKWREEAKSELKRNLLENADLREKYVTERQERILLDRDRVASKTWYNEDRKRWEMDSIAVPYAVSRRLVESARIRHDWAAMYVALKGEDKEYFVDIKEFDMLFEDFGGFDGLYLRMLASGIPTVVQLMPIPLRDLDVHQQFVLMIRLSQQCINGLWSSKRVSYAREWALEKIRNVNDDIMMMIVFPLVEFVVPLQVRMRLGMAWPEFTDQTAGSTWYLKWQSEAEMSFRSRKTDEFLWFLWFLIRSAIYGYVLFHLFRFLKRKVPRLLGYGPIRRDPNFRKLRRVKFYFEYRMKKIRRKKKDGVDPISTAFDQMKRVKSPPIRLKDFASVESMREEINEVVAFLQNPKAFQEMGARAPRVCSGQDFICF